MSTLLRLILNVCLLLTGLAILGFGAMTVLGFAEGLTSGRLSWACDLMSHFRVQLFFVHLALMALVIGFALLKPKKAGILRWLFAVNLTFLGCNGALLLPYYLPQSMLGYNTTGTHARFRVMQMNVLGTNRNLNAAEAEIRRANPDILSLQEYNVWWREHLGKSALLKSYPYRFLTKNGDDGVYSRIPFMHVEAEYITPDVFRADVSIVAALKIGGQPVTLLFSHPPTPVSMAGLERLTKHFQFWVAHRQHYGENFAIIGDMNSTPWSAPFLALLNGTYLRDSQLGFGIQRTYPSFNWPKRIPIDHCLVSPNFKVFNRQVGHFTGSDHFPIIVDLGI